MNSLRRWLYRPKRSDSSLLAQFYFADEDLNLVAAELDSFEGRKDPERCTTLVNQLRACQARVLNVVSQMMDEQVKDFRASRDFRVKFPDDVIQENLAGQLWFGAECLAAGSSIMNREVESACMRPLARALTKNLDSLRNVLRDQCLRSVHEYTETIKESLIIFDKLFAEFELSYVSAMVPVKTAHEYDLVQEITVLFSETVQRALQIGLLTRDMIDEYDPALMFTIPRLAIVSGAHIFKDGPLNPDNDPWNLSEMFRPFQTLLLKIRELLGILTDEELNTLERALCSQVEPSFLISLEEKKKQDAREVRRKSREERKYRASMSKKKKDKEESDDGSMENELTALEIAKRLEALALNFETSRHARLALASENSDLEVQNKSSGSLSTSSSSFQSEGEAEDGNSVDAVISNGTDHMDETHLQHFTNQLYYEANLDSRCATHDVAIVEHHRAFSPESAEPPVHNSINGNEDSAPNTKHSVSSDASDDHNIADDGGEAAAVGRAHFAMNKCDSSDSGLHSEVLSNSGSTFTISSSDSNQHVAAISGVLGTSECHQDCPDPSHQTDDPVTKNQQCTNGIEHPPHITSGDSARFESRNSSDTLVSDSDVKNRDDKLCLKSPPGCREDSSGASDSQLGTVFVSANEHHKLMNADDATKLTENSEQQPTGKETVNSALTNMCDNLLIHNTVNGTSQALTRSSECSNESFMQTSETDGGINNNLCHITKNRNPNEGYNIHGSESISIIQATAAGSSCELEGNSFETLETPTSLNCSSVAVEKSGLEHSNKSHSVTVNLCDSTSPEEGGVCNNLHAMRVDTSLEDIVLRCTSSENFTSESFHSHLSVPPVTVSEDKENNNEIQKCAILSDAIDTHSTDHVEPVILHEDDADVELQTGAVESHTRLSSELVPVEISHSSSILATSTDAIITPATVKASDPSSLFNSARDAIQDSGKLSSHPSPSSLHNGIQNHTSATNATNSSPSGPETSSVKTSNRGVKGSSKARSLKKSSKIRRQPQESSSRLDSKSNLPSQAKALMESQLLESECNHSSETSSYTSECGDQEEIDLAIKAAENATRQQVRARFQSSSDMIHRLFVCISGVADQLQTNFAGDLRNILRAVFDMNCSELVDITAEDKCKDTTPLEAAYRAVSHASRTARRARSSANQKQEPPSWIPDEQSNDCMSCQVPFTFVRRRHHCRNCGKIFCSRCSSNFVPLPHFGQDKAVRVCNRCFMFQVTPFTARPSSQ